MIHPILYEINTRCWLRDLSSIQGRAVTLGNVPETELDRWCDLGFSHLWLMGVWTPGPRSRARSLEDARLRNTLDRVLPGWSEDDVP